MALVNLVRARPVYGDGRDSSELEGTTPSQKIKCDYSLPTPSQSTGSVEGVVGSGEGSVERPVEDPDEGSSERRDEESDEGLVDVSVAPYPDLSSKMAKSHPVTYKGIKKWLLEEDNLYHVMISYVELHISKEKLKMYHRVRHLNPQLYDDTISTMEYLCAQATTYLKTLIVEGSYGRVKAWLDSLDDVLPTLSHETTEAPENMESYSPVERSSKMVQSHPPVITEDLKQLVLEEKDIDAVVSKSIQLQGCKMRVEIYESICDLDPGKFLEDIKFRKRINGKNETYLKLLIVEGGCDKLMEVIGNC